MKPQNKKRFRAAVLLLILLFVLSACSRGQSESSAPESTSARPYQQSRKKPRSRKQSSRRHRTLPQMKPFSISAQGTVALPNTL